MHDLIDIDGNSYNIDLKIKYNKLIAVFDGQEEAINLKKCAISIRDLEE